MTPVEKGITFSWLVLKSRAISLQYFLTSFKPLGPVAAFAFPALINKIFSVFFRFNRFSIANMTGAALSLLEVNFPLSIDS